MVSVKLINIWKSYGNVMVLRNLSLEVKNGELMVILGPSGVGKTTTLKIIAGILKPDRGKIYFDNKDVTALPPWERNIGIVFQSPALFPHMTVWENIAFGLEARKWPVDQIIERVEELLDMFRLRGLEDRYPRELSGGQQQRVAIARALAIKPRLLLMDEPFANLDPLLRDSFRWELRRIQERLGITTIFVTHDQEEAFQIADNLAIMLSGKIMQVGEPSEVYNDPLNEEIARFLGINVINVDEIVKKAKLPCNKNARKVILWPEEIELTSKEGIPAVIKNVIKIKGSIRIRALIPGNQEIEIIKHDENKVRELLKNHHIYVMIKKCKCLY